jgi:hypothetical protein
MFPMQTNNSRTGVTAEIVSEPDRAWRRGAPCPLSRSRYDVLDLVAGILGKNGISLLEAEAVPGRVLGAGHAGLERLAAAVQVPGVGVECPAVRAGAMGENDHAAPPVNPAEGP